MMSDQTENTKSENWRVLLPSLSKDVDLAFCEWSWALRDCGSTEEAVVRPITPTEARRFYDECLAVESEHILIPHDGGESSTGAVFFRRIVDESPELAFLINQPYPFDVEFPNGERRSFHPKGWVLLAIANLQKDGSVFACSHSEVTRPVYIFESREGNLHWLLIKPGIPLKAEGLSAQAAADWFAKAGLEQPNSVQDAAGVERLTPGDLGRATAKESPPSSPHDVNPAENASESTSPLSRPDDDESGNAASCGLVVGEDGRSVRYLGKEYSFGPNQSVVVKMLYDAWRKGVPDVGQETLLQAIDPNAPPRSIRDVFRQTRNGITKPHPAYGTLIVKGNSKGTFRFNVPCTGKGD